jgi:uncharacterized protein YeaO (DUF488 family)
VLKQGSVADIKRGSLSRSDGYIVVSMRFYPRFLRKELRDEFIVDLAPKKELLHDFNAAAKRLGNHNDAFPEVDYENRFELSMRAFSELQRLAKLSETRDVYIVCVCKVGDRCHREILMLIANKLFAAKIDKVFHSYPDVMRRLPDLVKKA